MLFFEWVCIAAFRANVIGRFVVTRKISGISFMVLEIPLLLCFYLALDKGNVTKCYNLLIQ